jgi:nitrogen fixation/metabolism regulation signal transduction histidine kinase
MLLSHTSGLANLRYLEEDRQLKLYFDPGSRYAYSGEGLILLQLVVEEITGKPLRELMEQQVFQPLGMSRTSMVWESSFGRDFANYVKETGRGESQAWQKLIRVLGHELNNSLAPIKSIAGSLRSRVDENGFPEDAMPDFERGLAVIESRAEALNRFVQGYREFAKLPPPRKREISIGPLLERVVKLETRLEVQLAPCPDLDLYADPDQLEHLLINLVRNGVEATRERMAEEHYLPHVQITWTAEQHWLRISVLDNGVGLSNPANLFVPFYTTKDHGSGVGLILARQIAEVHNGSLQLANRTGAQGSEAQVRLPRNQ